MKYDDEARFKLFWAIIVGLVLATLMLINSGCASSLVVCKNYDPTVSGKYGVCEVVKTN